MAFVISAFLLVLALVHKYAIFNFPEAVTTASQSQIDRTCIFNIRHHTCFAKEASQS